MLGIAENSASLHSVIGMPNEKGGYYEKANQKYTILFGRLARRTSATASQTAFRIKD
jgi:hypothetical protein